MKTLTLILFLFTLQIPAMAKMTSKPKITTKKGPDKPTGRKPTSTMLKDTPISATRLVKPSGVTALYPKGSVKNTQVDSIKKANPALGRAIGKPISKSGEQNRYGTSQSDLIKSAIRPKKK